MTDPWKRREQFGNATLYLGDSLPIMEAIHHVDAVVTDPPYGIGADAKAHKAGSGGGEVCTSADLEVKKASLDNTNKKRHGWVDHGDTNWDKERPSKEYFDQILAMSDVQIIWGGNYFTDWLPPTMRWLIWDKGQRNFSLADGEMAWCSQNNAMRIMTYARGKARTDGTFHPTQKPIEIMEWCLGFLPKGIEVLDPFMGSGTTGIACHRAGRAFYGIEAHEAYFDIACKRIEEAQNEPDMFVAAEAAKPVQDSMF